MYIKYSDYIADETIYNSGDVILMSAAEFANGGKNIMDIPVTVTPTGNEPVEEETE